MGYNYHKKKEPKYCTWHGIRTRHDGKTLSSARNKYQPRIEIKRHNTARSGYMYRKDLPVSTSYNRTSGHGPLQFLNAATEQESRLLEELPPGHLKRISEHHKHAHASIQITELA